MRHATLTGPEWLALRSKDMTRRFTCNAIEQRHQLNTWIRMMAEVAQEVGRSGG